MASQPEDQVLCRYAVAFGVEGPPAAGLLVVGDDGVVLRGSRGGEHVELSVPREELTRVRIGRSSAERLNGYKTIVLERRDGPDILVAPFGLALLHEITDLIGALAHPTSPAERVELLVPIKRESCAEVRRLIANGPPFDPAELGLDRHDVYVSDTQVWFVFEGTCVHDTLQRTLTDAGVWRAGLAWRSCISGRPRLVDQPTHDTIDGELIYSWRR